MRYDTLIIEPLREMLVRVAGFIPTLFIALGILIVGWGVVKIFSNLFTRFLHRIGFDTLIDSIGLTKFLRTGGLKHKPSELLGCITYSILMVMVLIMTVKSFGLTVVSELVDTILAYIPNVVSGVVTLIIGMVIARFVSALVYITAKNTDMPSPATLSRLSKLAIMAYVVILFLKQIGFVSLFVDGNFTVMTTGIVFALSLAFGLAGKDVAGRYLDVFNIKKAHHK